MYIDSHCHIEDIETINRAFEANVSIILNAGKDLDEMDLQLQLADKYPSIWTSAGIHPDQAKEKLPFITEETIINKTHHPKVIAIGECGLDYYYGNDTKTEQQEMFSRHINASLQTNLPIMIHQRQAEQDTISLLAKASSQSSLFTGVIHCFTSTKEFAKQVLDLGFYISASGIITFNSGQELLEVFKYAPLDRILVETDSPYLAPTPYRGKPNQPSYIIKTYEKLAQAKNISKEELASIVKNNFFNLYTKANISTKG